MEKICIIGGSGTGKTTLSNNLSRELSLPVIHLDGINYLENWKKRDEKERDKMILEKSEQPEWIIDGTYNSTLGKRLEKADCIIHLDYSSIAQIKGILNRVFKNHGKEKEEIPGCGERFSLSFIIWVWKWRKNKRETVLEEINKVDSEKVLIFHSRRELNKWYENTFGKKIEI